MTDRTELKKAFNYKIQTNCSIRLAGLQYGIKPMTRKVNSIWTAYISVIFQFKRFFSPEIKEVLVNYVVSITKIFYGLPKEDHEVSL